MEIILDASQLVRSKYKYSNSYSVYVAFIFFSQQTTSSPRHTGSQISILIHSCDKSVLLDFIEAARLQYREASISRVNVHLTDGYENWGRVISKSRRSFSTLILPDGIKETLLSDMKEFLDSEEW
jgi:hypothetical protein